MADNKNLTDNTNLEEVEELVDTLVFEDEDGNDIVFELLAELTVDGKDYVVLLPLDDEEGEESIDVTILETEAVEGEEFANYFEIEDVEVVNKVYDAFKEKFKEEFNFAD